LIFLAIYLYRSDILKVPVLYSRINLGISMIFLFCGFLFQALNWKQVLKPDYPIKFRDAISSVGLSIFTKYIPGKVAVILGRATYVNKKYGYSNKNLIRVSFEAQILILWVGLIVGSLSLVWIGEINKFGYIAVGFIVIFGIFLITPIFQNIVSGISYRVLKKRINIGHLGYRRVFALFPLFTVYWSLYGVGFYYFLLSFSTEPIPFLSGFSFPLATTLGIAAIIAPGGIGVREGILATLLHLNGIDLAVASSLAILSRLWFLIGEFFLFILGVIVHSISMKKNKESNHPSFQSTIDD